MPASRSLPAFFILALALTGLVHSPAGTKARHYNKQLQLWPIDLTSQPLMAQLRRAYSTLSVAKFLPAYVKRKTENSSFHGRF